MSSYALTKQNTCTRKGIQRWDVQELISRDRFELLVARKQGDSVESKHASGCPSQERTSG